MNKGCNNRLFLFFQRQQQRRRKGTKVITDKFRSFCCTGTTTAGCSNIHMNSSTVGVSNKNISKAFQSNHHRYDYFPLFKNEHSSLLPLTTKQARQKQQRRCNYHSRRIFSTTTSTNNKNANTTKQKQPSSSTKQKFQLCKEFVNSYANKKPPFGFNGLGELVYMRTYSRLIINNNDNNNDDDDSTTTDTIRKEQWYETIERVVNGTYNIQLNWLLGQQQQEKNDSKRNNVDNDINIDINDNININDIDSIMINDETIQQSAQNMYKLMYEMKFLPPGRGLYGMGTNITENKKLYAALNNCAFVSTEHIGIGTSTSTSDNSTGIGNSTNSRSSSGSNITASSSSMTTTSYSNINITSSLSSSSDTTTSSSSSISTSPAEPFCFLMDASMLGIGVGFDTKGSKNNIVIHRPLTTSTTSSSEKNNTNNNSNNNNNNNNNETNNNNNIYQIPDSREGWVKSVELLLESYLLPNKLQINFDYTLIRPEGMPIKGFGGTSSGYKTLKILHESITSTLTPDIGKTLSVRNIVDIMNHIGVCVVSGNVRRTAEIAFGEYDDDEYINLKNYDKNPDRMQYGWSSNNSIYAQLGMNYKDVCDRIVDNGEPGFAFLHNMRAYSRMNNMSTPDYKDIKAQGGNPCLEQTLESYEMCCLVETFPTKHDNVDEFLHTLKYAFLYAKTVTLTQTHWAKANDVMMKNRRIGCSMSGIVQFISKFNINELMIWSNAGYDYIQQLDEKYSTLFQIPTSIKTTSIKPSGTVSLLAGATPGVHYPESRYYIRRVRFDINSSLIQPLIDAGYHVEDCAVSPSSTVVVSIPIDIGPNIRTLSDGDDNIDDDNIDDDTDNSSSSSSSSTSNIGGKRNNNNGRGGGGVSMWEQLLLASFLQEHWADNQVSCTVSFDPETEGGQLHNALNYFQYKLKGVSFLPRISCSSTTVYKQMPYEKVNKEQYTTMSSKLKPLNFSSIYNDDDGTTSSDSDDENGGNSTRSNDSNNGSTTMSITSRSTGSRQQVEEAIPDQFCDSSSCKPCESDL